MNVLLSAVGRRAYLVEFFKHAIRPFGGKVCATNTIPEATGMLAADEKCVVPPSRDPAYIDKMVELCEQWHVKLLFSLHDWDSPIIAQSRERFLRVGTFPVVGPYDVITTCLDKYKMFLRLRKIGIPTPNTALSPEEAKVRFSYPMIVKPRWGQGSIGLFKATCDEELHLAYQLSDIKAREFSNALPAMDAVEPRVIIQPCLVGQEMGCDIVNDLTGKFRKAFVKRKLAMRSGETDVAESAANPQILALSEKLAMWSKHPGCMDSDWMFDCNGVPMLIDLNPRFGGGYPFTHCAGADVCRACVDWMRGCDDGSWCAGYREGVRTYKNISLMTVAMRND